MHESYLALDVKTLCTGTNVAYHHGPRHGSKGHYAHPEPFALVGKEEDQTDAEETDQLAVTVERRIPKCTKEAALAAHTGQSSIHHIEETGGKNDKSTPSDESHTVGISIVAGAGSHQGRVAVDSAHSQNPRCVNKEAGSKNIADKTYQRHDVWRDSNLYHRLDERIDHHVDYFL